LLHRIPKFQSQILKSILHIKMSLWYHIRGDG
jgi:hypothetical protein